MEPSLDETFQQNKNKMLAELIQAKSMPIEVGIEDDEELDSFVNIVKANAQKSLLDSVP